MIKKLGLFIFGLVSLGLINFSCAINCATETTYTANSDGYLLIRLLQGNNIDSNTYVNFDSTHHKQKVSLINDTYGYGYKINSVNEGTTHQFWQLFEKGDIITISPTSNITRCLVDFVEKNIIQDSSSCSPSGQCSVSDKVSENIIFSGSKNFSTSYSNMFNYGDYGAGTYCLKFTSSNPQTLSMGFANGPTTTPTNLYSLYADQYGNTICLYGNKPYLNVKLNASSNTIDYEVYKLADLLSDDIPCGGSSSSCDYSEYESQIESLSGSLSLCQSENLTLSGKLTTCEGELNSCMSGVGSGNLQWSALYINNIQHLGGSIIRITIPEEISWDYTSENDQFNLDVEGYNVDTEYISGIIDTQSTLPNQVDLNNLVKVVLPLFVPGLVIILFIYFIFRFIKKIF